MVQRLQGFPARRGAAFAAYYENMPLRPLSVPHGGGMQLYRRVQWGSLATVHLLDTRQYRDDQPCGDRLNGDCPQRSDPARSITGATRPCTRPDLVGGSSRATHQ